MGVSGIVSPTVQGVEDTPISIYKCIYCVSINTFIYKCIYTDTPISMYKCIYECIYT